MSRLRWFVLPLAVLAPVSALAQPGNGSIATERDAVAHAVESSPSLKAALLQRRDADWAVTGESARYPWIVSSSANATRTASPRLVNEDLTVAEVYVADASGELKKRLRWGTDLSFSVRGTWQRGFTPLSSFAFVGVAPNGFQPTVALSARAGLNQPLLRGAGPDVTLAGLAVATRERTQAERQAERIASGLLRDVLLGYWETWYAGEALRIQEQSLDFARRQREDASARVATGSLAPSDALPFETRLATRGEEVATARAELERQRITLAGRIGILGREPSVGTPSEEAPESPAPPAANLEDEVLAHSPELAELAAAVDVARVQRRTAGDANRARLDASAYVQLDGLGRADAGAALEQLATFGAVSAHAGLTFEAPFDAGQRRAAIGRADMALALAEARLDEKRQQVIADLRTALAREAGARERTALGEQTIETAQRQLEAERQRFATGSATALQVLQAEDDLRNARIRVARARVDRLEQAIARDHFAGRLLLRYEPLVRVRLGSIGSIGASPSGIWSRTAY